MMNTLKKYLVALFLLFSLAGFSQDVQEDVNTYKKRVLETTELDVLSSYYGQTGENAAVSGGLGTESLTDFTTAFVVSMPLNEDDVLTIDAGISAYTSASSSNVDPFDNGAADAFQASSGASGGDVWANINGSYSHSSDDRNTVWSAKASLSNEYDYFSVGFGGGYTKLFNEKNTELSLSANAFIDSWSTIYPKELRSFADGKDGLNADFFNGHTITGNEHYNPTFDEFDNKGRNSYSIGLGFSQILHKNIQSAISLDIVQQSGLLSTPFQRVYFSDVEDSFIDNFQLADAIEQLPDARLKFAIGGRLNWYLNERISLRSYYRFYSDDWGIASHTASLEIPVKISNQFTLYPSYRFYNQTAADYFRPFETALSTDTYYTSDHDLSEFTANQYGFGISYNDIFTKMNIAKWGIKSIDLKFYKYDRDTTFSSGIMTLGVKFLRN